MKLSILFKYLTGQNYTFYFWGAVIGAGTSALGGLFGAKASEAAAEAAIAGKEAGTAESRRQFDITQEQLRPFREAGLRGLETYQGMLGGYDRPIPSDLPEAFSYDGFESDPGRAARIQGGLSALERRGVTGYDDTLSSNLATREYGQARGRAYEDYRSGVSREEETYQRGLERYGREYVDPMSRYAQLAGIGEATTTGLGRMRQSYADVIGQNIAQQGQLQAAGQLGQISAYSQGLRGIGKAVGSYYGYR